MLHKLTCLAICALIPAGPASGQEVSGPSTDRAPGDRWARHYHERVATFEKENASAGNIVLVGSSHIEGLNAKRWLPRWRIVNRGISSDRIGIGERGILHRLDSSVFDCDPAVVVLQNGANDLGELWRHGTPTMSAIDDCFRQVVRRIRTRLPDTPLIIVGVMPTRDRYAGLVPLLQEFDKRLARIALDWDCRFLEVYSHLADSDGLLRRSFSREGLHLTDEGYAVWTALLDRALQESTTRPGDTLPVESARVEPGSDLRWYDAMELVVEGKHWPDTDPFFARLPDDAESEVPDLVWRLSRNTAGIAIRFVTDSKTIGAIWDGGGAMNHMAATGDSGLDLYARRNGRWVFCGVGRPQPQRTTATVARGLSGAVTEYLLYLPLYTDVGELWIGIEPGAAMVRPPPRPARLLKPIVFYGTSITQGGCASRAGMSHAAILGRWFDREVINLGFSGSGKMEPAMAHLLASIDPAVYVLECLPNMTTAMVRERVRPFVRILRETRPTTPILLVESPFDAPTNPGNVELRECYADLSDAGVSRLFYLAGELQLAGTENGTVDGVHPTDLGFARMAEAYRPVLEAILTAHP